MLTKERNRDNLLLILVVVDILLLPYFNLMVIPMSYVIILFWTYINRKRIFSDYEIKAVLLCMVLMLISTMFGCIINSEYGVIGDNIKRLLQYYMVFGYYFFFKYNLDKKKINLKMLLWCFIIFVLILGIIYQMNVSAFVRITSIWNKGNAYNSAMITNSLFGYTNRYNFIWTDANNIAYAITGTTMFLLIYFKTALFEKLALFFINIYILVLCMSSGGWIGWGISWGLYIIYAIKNKKIINRYISKKQLLFSFVGIIVLIFVLSSGVLSSFANSDIVSAAIDRFQNNEESRTEIWLRILRGDNILKYIFIGKGSEIIVNGVNRATHSGHLYWIYAYGLISYGIILKKIFWPGIRNVKAFIPIISFFLCFTMNTMVGEQKLFIILIMLICYMRKEYLDSEKRTVSECNNTSI